MCVARRLEHITADDDFNSLEMSYFWASQTMELSLFAHQNEENFSSTLEIDFFSPPLPPLMNRGVEKEYKNVKICLAVVRGNKQLKKY